MFSIILYSREVFQQNPCEKLQYAALIHMLQVVAWNYRPVIFFLCLTEYASCKAGMSNALREKGQSQLLAMVCSLHL